MKVIFVVGPTASGKSALALRLAKKYQSCLINADSIQLYSELRIGSAAPTDSEKEQVPHFLYQSFSAPERLTAGDYAREVLNLLSNLKNKYEVVFVVGGTGFYLQALEKGLYPIAKADPAIQNRLMEELTKENGPEKLHLKLKSLDLEASQRISVNDHYRLVRALEIIQREGRSLTEIESEFAAKSSVFPYPLLKLGIEIERNQLRGQVSLRTNQMIKSGLTEETKALMDKGLENWQPLSSVGYLETQQFLKNIIPNKEELAKLITQNTMRLAKRQMTWFRRDTSIHWIKLDLSESSAIEKLAQRAELKVQDFLQH